MRARGGAHGSQKPGALRTSDELVAQLRAKLLTRSDEGGEKKGDN
jgi:hypothetical protein